MSYLRVGGSSPHTVPVYDRFSVKAEKAPQVLGRAGDYLA